MSSKPSARRLRARLIALIDGALGHFAAGILHVLRLFNRQAMANFAGAVMRTVGPWLPEHRVGRANLIAAFPEKPPEEIESILRGVWDNLGRFAAEFAHLDRIKTYDPAAPGPFDVEYSQDTFNRFHALRLDGKPALLFTAHLANWELSAQVATAYKLDTVVLYRRPNLGAAADAVARIRAGSMGTLMATGLDAPVKLADALLAGRHVAMLVDQYAVNGVDVTFFGQRTRANPLIARLARQVECPIHGARIVRLSGGRFRIDLTEAISPVRGADGRIDVAGTMQAITTLIEGWIREHPEQWLWVHRRWRPGDPRRFSARSSPSSKAD
jgi:KDO2-lipid IV(A) lauroyltransferase